jgi:WD40 repeat protein
MPQPPQLKQVTPVPKPSRPPPHQQQPSLNQASAARLGSKKRITIIPISELSMVGRMALSPTGNLIALAGMDGQLALYQLYQDSVLRILKAHASAVRDVAFTDDGKQLLSASANGQVRLWDLAQLGTFHVIRSLGSGIRRMAIKGHYLAVAGEQEQLEIYHLQSKKLIRRLTGHKGWVNAIAWSADGQQLASGGEDRVIRLWSMPQGNQTGSLVGHRLWITALAFSPDQRTLASSGLENTIQLWDLKSGRKINRFRAHARQAIDLTFNGRGQLLASASLDRTAKIWDVTSGELHTQLLGHLYQVSTIAFYPSRSLDASPPDDFVLTASTDGTVRLWPLPLPTPPTMALWKEAGPGELILRNNTTGERARIRIIDPKGKLLNSGRREIANILRSSGDERRRLPDIKLLKLLYRVADHFGRSREIIVISGYRSAEYNQQRRGQSRGVAKESQHLSAQAIDFRLQGITITGLCQYLKKLKAGGVGFYPDSQFVHMDTGPVRFWEGD